MPPGPVTESKIKEGVLTLGDPAVDFSCQPTNVRIEPTYAEDGDRAEVLCGTVLSPDTTRTDTLAMSAIQDFEDAAGLVNYSWEHDLEKVPFTWQPTGATGPTYSGTVEVRALTVGGDVNKRLSSDATWTIDGKAIRAEAPVGP